MDSLLTGFLTQMATQLPVLLVYFVGILLTFVFGNVVRDPVCLPSLRSCFFLARRSPSRVCISTSCKQGWNSTGTTRDSVGCCRRSGLWQAVCVRSASAFFWPPCSWAANPPGNTSRTEGRRVRHCPRPRIPRSVASANDANKAVSYFPAMLLSFSTTARSSMPHLFSGAVSRAQIRKALAREKVPATLVQKGFPCLPRPSAHDPVHPRSDIDTSSQDCEKKWVTATGLT